MIDTTAPPQKSPRGWRMRLLRIVMIYGCIPYVSVTVLFAIFQRRLMYHPTVAESLSVSHLKLGADFGRDVQIQTEDGHTLNGWLIWHRTAGGTSGEAPLVIYFPGNAGNRQERIEDLREVAGSGFDVLIFDYRGFGDSTGSPSEWALTADSQRVWQYACGELQYAPDRIVVFGESLGGAVALSLWSADSPDVPQPASVILNSTFASMPEVVGWHYPLFPFRYLLLDRWRSVRHMPYVQSPVIVFHGTADDIVPVSEGRTLAGQSANARFIEIPSGTHNEIPMIQLRQELEQVLAPRIPETASPESSKR